ncbi:MAG: N-acetylmuramoyl-L-alanine amidase [Crocinitomicaceae bacterium]|nr:N-acetylmuramoyl-L-alanine amidase [Crocinitomicaceae bacterium]
MKLFLGIILFLSASLFAGNPIIVVIDPGHGGSDPGHLSHDGKHLQEKEINLKIAMKLGHYLENNIQNVKVIYTRTTDIYPSLDRRVEIANQKGVDLFISIHCNGSPSENSYGTETHIYDRSSKESMKWAKLIEKEFKSRAGRHSRGIKTNSDRGNTLQVLKYTKGTSILVECGFLSNPTEAVYLNSSKGQDLIASALFRATRTYLQKKYPNLSFQIPQNSEPKTEEPRPEIAENEAKFKVQICSSSANFPTDGDKFSHLKYKVHQVEVSGKVKYKYYLGPFKSKSEAEDAMKNAQNGGYKDAFLVPL